MTFGEKLQDLRRKAGMSQDTLAEKLDVSRQAVSKWERDETMPETEKLVRIAQLFHASLDELLLDREPQTAPEPDPQPVYRPTHRHSYVNQFRRHGYKLGYILIAIGAIICAFSLIMRLVWPALATVFLALPMTLCRIFPLPMYPSAPKKSLLRGTGNYPPAKNRRFSMPSAVTPVWTIFGAAPSVRWTA